MRIVDILCQQRERSTYQRERERVEQLTTPIRGPWFKIGGLSCCTTTTTMPHLPLAN